MNLLEVSIMQRAVGLIYVLTCFLSSLGSLYAQTISDIAEHAMPSVVSIAVYDITGTPYVFGSGFFIAPGKILTNAHVVDGAYSVAISSDTEYYDQITILKSDEESDLALLSVEIRGESMLRFQEMQEIRPGQRVVTIGNPMGLEKTVSDGIVSGIRIIGDQLQIIQISAPISQGSSGGPLLSQEGRVIGVVSATLSEGQNLNFAVGIETVMQFLRRPDAPRHLQVAGSRVLWRFVLKWIVTIILGFLAFIFGGGWWVLIVIVLILSLVWWFIKGAYKIITAPFHTRHKEMIEDYGFESKTSYSYDESRIDESFDGPDLFTDVTEYDEEVETPFVFHCWKCGGIVCADTSDKTAIVNCENCGTRLTAPPLMQTEETSVQKQTRQKSDKMSADHAVEDKKEVDRPSQLIRHWEWISFCLLTVVILIPLIFVISHIIPSNESAKEKPGFVLEESEPIQSDDVDHSVEGYDYAKNGQYNKAISDDKMTWVKCNNPKCKAEYQMSEKEYFKSMEERFNPMARTVPALTCEKCGKDSLFRACKCVNPACGVVFFRDSVPNDLFDRCPECGHSETEDIRKQRMGGGN